MSTQPPSAKLMGLLPSQVLESHYYMNSVVSYLVKLGSKQQHRRVFPNSRTSLPCQRGGVCVSRSPAVSLRPELLPARVHVSAATSSGQCGSVFIYSQKEGGCCHLEAFIFPPHFYYSNKSNMQNRKCKFSLHERKSSLVKTGLLSLF